MSLALAPPTRCYRPRAAFQSPLWGLLSDHLDGFLSNYESRYQATHGPLPSYVPRALQQLASCGDPNLGITLFRCHECNMTLAVPFSCRCRLCSCCMSARSEDLSVHLAEILPEIAYRQVVVTFPIKMGIRERIRRDPDLLRRFTGLAVKVITRALRSQLDPALEGVNQAHPGVIAARHTWGSDLHYHPHVHLLITNGLYTPDGTYHGGLSWEATSLTAQVRKSILSSLVKMNRMQPETAELLTTWPIERSGFQVHVGHIVPATDRNQLRNLLKYLFRAPIALKHLRYDPVTARVTYTPRGVNKVWPHAYDFLADFIQHLPAPRKPAITKMGWFANRTGNLKSKRQALVKQESRAAPKCPRRSYWAQRVLRVWQLDPTLCPRCQQPMVRSKALLEWKELRRVLDAIGLLGYPPRPPPVPPQEADDIVNPDVDSDDVCQIPPDWDEM